jgi:hypothetical protein
VAVEFVDLDRSGGIGMLFVTLHGGNPEKDPHKNNVQVYDKDGNKITSCALDNPEDFLLNELRGICLVGKYLYVVNANKDENCVLCYEGMGTQYKYVSTFISSQTCNGILHPFDLTFDGLGYCYLSSQDTNVVTRLIVSEGGKAARPAPVAAGLPSAGTFLSGTFVASSDGTLLPQATTPVKIPAGLQYAGPSGTTNKKHSVRGVVWASGHLFVVDQPAGTVKIYDITGKYMGQSNVVESPVHVVVHNGSLYVSGGDEVLTAKIPSPPGNFVLSAIKSVKVKNGSGMAFSNSGNFYVASRTENVILKFDPNFNPMKFRCDLPDNPEFLLHV